VKSDRAADPARGETRPIARQIDLIVLHCSATDNPAIRAADIDRWHRNRGFNSIGYHFFIRTDGVLEIGRDLDKAGAHASGYNSHSIGICLNGLSRFTPAQFNTLRALLTGLKPLCPHARLVGHNELNPGKACPVYSVGPFKEFWQSFQPCVKK
jgi:N-acetylmuramoyl-L-alanine amidase